jgi:predicted amidohydrolase YtcJ
VDPHTHILNDAWRIDRDTLGGQELALEHGITTLGNLFTTPEILDEMRGHDEAGGLRARISLYLIATDNCGVVQDDWWQSVAPTRSPGELLRIGGVKLFLDGGTCGDWATTEPIQPGGGVATPFLETAEIEAIIVAAAERGHQVVIHSIGDIATLRALDAIIATTEPANPLRHRVDHLTMVTDEVIERFGDSGAVGAVFGYYPSCGDFEVTPFFEAGVRRHQDLMAANPDAVVAWHGDDPWVGPVSPLQELHNMVTRVEIGDDGTECPPPPYLADRTFDVMTGLRMMTIDAAYALHRETEVGSLEAGKFADLVVLSADPTSVAEREIYDIEVLATIVGGHAEVCRDEAVCPPR